VTRTRRGGDNPLAGPPTLPPTVVVLLPRPALWLHALAIVVVVARKAGVAAETIRLSIGLEDPEDIIRDLDQALNSSA
jgi:hypothetical protein